MLTPGQIKRALRRRATRLKFRAHTFLGRYPKLLFGFYRIFALNNEYRVRRDTALVIEAFPRSGTTFCYCAFQQAQSAPLEVAYHLHLPAQVIQACRWNIPALVVIREPVAAVSSALVREPYLDIKVLLERYKVFYQALEPWRDRFVLAGFEQAVNDFGQVTRTINERFCCDFRPFDATDRNTEAVRLELEDRHRVFGGGPEQSYLPNPEKELAKSRVSFFGNEKLLADCTEIYQRYQGCMDTVN